MKLWALLSVVYGMMAFAGPVESLRASTVHLPVGSGSIVQAKSGHKYVLTNWHVCIPSRLDGTVMVSYPNGASFRGVIKAYNANSDVCIIDAPQDLPALVPAEKFNLGSKLYTRGWPEHILRESTGHPLHYMFYDYVFSIGELGECPQSYKKIYGSNGNLAGCGNRFYNLLTDLYSQPGSSGSPVVNEKGELIGIIESYHPDAGAGLVPFELVKKFLDRY